MPATGLDTRDGGRSSCQCADSVWSKSHIKRHLRSALHSVERPGNRLTENIYKGSAGGHRRCARNSREGVLQHRTDGYVRPGIADDDMVRNRGSCDNAVRRVNRNVEVRVLAGKWNGSVQKHAISQQVSRAECNIWRQDRRGKFTLKFPIPELTGTVNSANGVSAPFCVGVEET